MDDLQFNIIFNSNSVISGRCLDDNDRLCAMEFRLRLRSRSQTWKLDYDMHSSFMLKLDTQSREIHDPMLTSYM